MYGDTTVIRQRAQQVRAQAATIREEATTIRDRVAAVPWQGLAADAMRGGVLIDLARLEQTAQRHDEAAAALELHASRVDWLKETIAWVEKQVRDLVTAARDRLAGVAAAIADGFRDVFADPRDQLLDRFVAPPRGHRDWLDLELPGLSPTAPGRPTW